MGAFHPQDRKAISCAALVFHLSLGRESKTNIYLHPTHLATVLQQGPGDLVSPTDLVTLILSKDQIQWSDARRLDLPHHQSRISCLFPTQAHQHDV